MRNAWDGPAYLCFDPVVNDFFMPTFTKTTEGPSALLRSGNGKLMHPKMSEVHQRDSVLSTQDGVMQLTSPQGGQFIAQSSPSELEFPSPSAGLSGGVGGALSEGYRVGRIAEELTPASLNFGADIGGVNFIRPLAGSPGSPSLPAASVPAPVNGTPSVGSEAPPVLNLDANHSSGATASHFVTTFTEDGTAVAIGDIDASIADADSTTLQGATLTLRNPHAGDVLTVGALPEGITATVVGPVVTLSGAASAADYQAALRSVAYSNTIDNPDVTPRTVEVVVTDGVQVSNVATTTVNVNSINDRPVAANDTQSMTEDGAVTTLTVDATNGVIQSASATSARDIDIDDVALSIVAVHTGGEADVGTTGVVGSGLVGTYGTLTLNADGSYTYALNNSSAAVQQLNVGEIATDVYTYTVSDGRGGTDTATLTIQVSGSQDLAAGPPTLTPLITTGLSGAYYGYNDTATTAPGLRTHADDGTATFGHHGVNGNLNAVEDLSLVINGRNQAAGGSGDIVGTNTSAQTNAADATFQGRYLSYGFSPSVDAALGSNAAVAAGTALPASDATLFATRGLSNFLSQDAASAVAQTGAGNTQGTSGLGRTSDAAVRLSGQIYVEPGSYDFRVTADDGFRLKVAGETLIEYDGNQWPTVRVFTNVPLGDLGGGLQAFELLYWEQGGNARLRIEYKPTEAPASAYQVMSDTNTALFGDTAPVLTDPRIQDLVHDSGTGWQVRTGSVLDGDASNNTLLGSAGRDVLRGGAGNDLLNGGGGADQLEGGSGNDTLIGDSGSDLLIGGAGNDNLVGGAGDDIYRLSDDNDTLLENAVEGIDTIQLDAGYVASHLGSTYALADNFENLTAQGTGSINLVGNSADNRLIGNNADNQLNGRDGNDFLVGGAGNDTLTGGLGADVFAWHLSDAGAPGNPAVDTLTDFLFLGGHSSIESGVSGVPTGGGDVLDLRDLLQGEHTSAGGLGLPASNVEISNLGDYIDVEVIGGNTILHLSSAGGFTGGTFNASAEDERVVLQGVDLYAVTGISAGDENALLKTLIQSGSMIVD